MTPHTCQIKDDPPSSYGDCLRACVATMLDIDPNNVPHFYHDGCEPEEGNRRLDAFLKTQNLRSFWIASDGSVSKEDGVFPFMKAHNPGVHYLLYGRTASGGEHVVICKDDAIVHDPGIVRTTLPKPTVHNVWLICIFVPLIICD